jgi:hypothetical protein
MQTDLYRETSNSGLNDESLDDVECGVENHTDQERVTS